jgi:hypothetical protein
MPRSGPRKDEKPAAAAGVVREPLESPNRSAGATTPAGPRPSIPSSVEEGSLQASFDAALRRHIE